MEAHRVRVGDFKGPIEVLLRLVEEKKLHISQVSLATVTDGFIKYLGELEADERSDKGQVANFILVASTLMLIKSVSLLPTLEVSPEERGSMEDLELRLRRYQEIKKLSEYVRTAYGRKTIFAREPSKEIVPVFSLGCDLTTANLAGALRHLISRLPKAEKLPQVVVRQVLNLEEVITALAARVQNALQTTFRDFVRDRKEKINVIISFLGMLELVKRGIVNVEQKAHFQDINIEATEAGVPRYL